MEPCSCSWLLFALANVLWSNCPLRTQLISPLVLFWINFAPADQLLKAQTFISLAHYDVGGIHLLHCVTLKHCFDRETFKSYFFIWASGAELHIKEFLPQLSLVLPFAALTIKNAALCIVLKKGLLAF